MKGDYVVVFNYDKLRGKIIEKYRSISNFAKQLGVAQSGLYMIISSGKPLSSVKIIEMCELLEITQEEIGSYFFECSVSNG